MEKTITDYLQSHEIGCVAIEIKDGVHAATIHYTFLEDENIFYFQTNLDSRKCQLLKDRSETAASFVVGFTEDEWKTFQADGTARLITDPEERKKFSEIRRQQFPGTDYVNDLEVAFIEFKPTWWRYTNFNTKPNTVISSE